MPKKAAAKSKSAQEPDWKTNTFRLIVDGKKLKTEFALQPALQHITNSLCVGSRVEVELASMEAEPDWKAIAQRLARWVKFSVDNLTERRGQSGMLMEEDPSTGVPVGLRHWSEHFADALDQVPGLKVDREMLRTMRLSPAKRKAAQARIKLQRAGATK